MTPAAAGTGRTGRADWPYWAGLAVLGLTRRTGLTGLDRVELAWAGASGFARAVIGGAGSLGVLAGERLGAVGVVLLDGVDQLVVLGP